MNRFQILPSPPVRKGGNPCNAPISRLRAGDGAAWLPRSPAQCATCDAYHPADRHLVLELLTDEGRPARPGEMGCVIATLPFNRAMPLIRYETGDYATLAESNACSRSTEALKQIIGRERNLFKLPGGR